MHLPTSLKALKYVAQGQSFSKARQIVKDRRVAKAIHAEGQAIDKQVAGDAKFAQRLAEADNDGSHIAQDLVLRMGQVHLAVRESKEIAARVKAAPPRPALKAQPSAAILAQAQASWDKAMAQHAAMKAAERQRDLAALQRGRIEASASLGSHLLPLPPRRGASLKSLATPPLVTSRRSSVSSIASDLSTPSEPGIMSFWQPAQIKPRLPRSGSDPDVGGFVTMAEREEFAEV